MDNYIDFMNDLLIEIYDKTLFENWIKKIKEEHCFSYSYNVFLRCDNYKIEHNNMDKLDDGLTIYTENINKFKDDVRVYPYPSITINQTTFYAYFKKLDKKITHYFKTIYNKDKELWDKLITFIYTHKKWLISKNEMIRKITTVIDLDDETIFYKIRSFDADKNTHSNTDNNTDNTLYKAQNLITTIKDIINMDSITNMLDFGCGDGKLTYNIGNILNLNSENINGCDVRDISNEKITFKKITETGTLPYENNYFSVIFISVVLHHIIDNKPILSEIYRILKPGGYLVIKEHDCKNELFSKYLDIIHGLYAISLPDDIEDEEFWKSYEAKYFDINQLKNIIIQNKFNYITHTKNMGIQKLYFMIANKVL